MDCLRLDHAHLIADERFGGRQHRFGNKGLVESGIFEAATLQVFDGRGIDMGMAGQNGL